MHIREITLEGFRNYSEFSTEFSDHVNVVIGDNAQGKTNLLEAVYFHCHGAILPGKKRPRTDRFREGQRPYSRGSVFSRTRTANRSAALQTEAPAVPGQRR